MATHKLRTLIAHVSAEQFTSEMAASAAKLAGMGKAERDNADWRPALPLGVTYNEQGRFMLDVPGAEDDIQVKIGDVILRDADGVLMLESDVVTGHDNVTVKVKRLLTADEFEVRYEPIVAEVVAPVPAPTPPTPVRTPVPMPPAVAATTRTRAPRGRE